MEFQGQVLRKGERIGLLLAGANRDPSAWDDASVFDPSRPVRTNFSFGAGRISASARRLPGWS